MNDAAISLTEAPVHPGDWTRDADGRVMVVLCECGAPVYYRGMIHSRLVNPHNGTALCKRCREWVRVPAGFSNQ